MASKAGGGINSKQRREVGYRQGSRREEIRPGGVGQLGANQGNHSTKMGDGNYKGEKLHGGAGYPSELGNAKALATQCGPGGSRQVMTSGSQHGLNANPQRFSSPDTLNEYGPNYRGNGRR